MAEERKRGGRGGTKRERERERRRPTVTKSEGGTGRERRKAVCGAYTYALLQLCSSDGSLASESSATLAQLCRLFWRY